MATSNLNNKAKWIWDNNTQSYRACYDNRCYITKEEFKQAKAIRHDGLEFTFPRIFLYDKARKRRDEMYGTKIYSAGVFNY